MDYIFREVNNSFEEQTGLRAEAVLGRRVTEVLPGIEKSDPDLISIYGDVAINDRDARFEMYSGPLERHYEVAAYSPAPRHFGALFQDITERKNAQQVLEWAWPPPGGSINARD